jgi:hypothetical protein
MSITKRQALAALSRATMTEQDYTILREFIDAAQEPTARMGATPEGLRQIEECPELNTANYDSVDVDRLNDWAIRADAEIDRLAAAPAPAGEPAANLREVLEEFDHALSQWAKAYPPEVFPEPDFGAACPRCSPCRRAGDQRIRGEPT